MNNYRLYRKIHLLLTIPFGLFIFLIAFSGASLVFEPEITSFVVDNHLAELSGKPLRLPYFAFMFKLHRSLEIGKIGNIIVGWTVWGLFLLYLSGFLMWAKVAVKQPLKSFNLNFPFPLRGWHATLGVYLTFFVLIIGISGLVWNETWFHNFFYSVFDTGENNLYHILYEIHVGTWGGLATRIIWIVSALGLASLPITGLMLYLKRNKKRE